VHTGIAIFAHGSAIESANESVRLVSQQFARSGGFSLVEPAFLELGQPDLAGAVSKLAGAGARRVIVIPYFLTLGKHLQRDLPRLVSEVAAQHPGLEIAVAPPLDGHPALISALIDRARQEQP